MVTVTTGAKHPIDPNNSALLLMDLQNDLVKGGMPVEPMGSEALIGSCQKVISKAREVGIPIVYVREAYRPDDVGESPPLLGAKPSSGGGSSLTDGTRGAEIVAELSPRPEDIVVTKMTASPFNDTVLEVYLRRLGVEMLLLAGYSTTGVVAGCLRSARDKDYDCVVIRDCCGARTVQEQEVLMDITFPRMAWVATSDEVIQAIKRR